MVSDLDLAVADVVEAADNRTSNSTPATIFTATRVTLLLTTLFGWGVLGATLVQQIAEAVVDDIQASGGVPSASLLKLASLGASGSHPSNCRREFWRWLKPALSLLPEPFCIRAPFVRARTGAAI